MYSTLLYIILRRHVFHSFSITGILNQQVQDCDYYYISSSRTVIIKTLLQSLYFKELSMLPKYKSTTVQVFVILFLPTNIVLAPNTGCYNYLIQSIYNQINMMNFQFSGYIFCYGIIFYYYHILGQKHEGKTILSVLFFFQHLTLLLYH